MFPLFGGIPGGPELLILFVILLFMLGIPLAFGVGLFLLGRWSADDSDDDEIELLRDRINTLEAEVEARKQVAEESEADHTDDADRER